ncbi:MAG: GatB/YqeY domain-containing protein [Deltaproteobacteria bacterium]|nr:GatB/YqeY domain-containing protein [Deltaproteobacteria bacterium]MBW2416932.1 GatB/YqeY domain-containing protein [Deltaproteobacteria bacterium]
MSIALDVSEQMKEAMKAKDKIRVTALRSIRASLLNEMKKDNSTDLPDETSITLLRRLEKQRGESIEAFEKAGRTEQVEAERGELAVIREFLPSLADEAATRAWVQEAIDASGAGSPGDVGRVMGALMKAHKGEIDGGLAKKIASELLSG